MVGFAAENALHALVSMIIGAAPVAEIDIDELQCMAQNIWFETRSGGFEDKIAVGHVVMNRVADPNYPDNVCDVVWQPYQFSWTHDGISDDVQIANGIDWDAWMESVMAAHLAIKGSMVDLSNGATHYHADYVAPNWRLVMTEVATHGRHIYYNDVPRPSPRPAMERSAVLLAENHSVSEQIADVRPAAGDDEKKAAPETIQASLDLETFQNEMARRVGTFWEQVDPELHGL